MNFKGITDPRRKPLSNISEFYFRKSQICFVKIKLACLTLQSPFNYVWHWRPEYNGSWQEAYIKRCVQHPVF